MIRRFLVVARTIVYGLCLAACVEGCGGGDTTPVVPVTGKVTFQGKPLAGASIVFVPADFDPTKPVKKGENVSLERPGGQTDADGAYELMYFEQTGAPPGKYKVSITAYQARADGDDEESMPPSLIPVKYANPATSGLKADVKEEGENVFNFPLE